jgi:cell division septum initiation protein DivIVA
VEAIIGALLTGLLAGGFTVVVALIQRRNQRAMGEAVQTVEQVAAKAEADRMLDEAEAKAERVRDEAALEAAKVVARAQERSERTEAEREGWHERQVRDLVQEVANARADNVELRLELTKLHHMKDQP